MIERDDRRPVDGLVDGLVDGTNDRAVYIISVAAELAGVHPQTLRIYEQKGLVQPQRTRGNVRRYSQADIVRLRRVQGLTAGGMNLAGAKRVIELEEEIDLLRDHVARLEAMLEDRPIPMPGRRGGVEIVPLGSIVTPPWARGRG
jgi:MerR family transcriptional regulator/heat shock protein HspR